jgi:hypothetical protein
MLVAPAAGAVPILKLVPVSALKSETVTGILFTVTVLSPLESAVDPLEKPPAWSLPIAVGAGLVGLGAVEADARRSAMHRHLALAPLSSKAVQFLCTGKALGSLLR